MQHETMIAEIAMRMSYDPVDDTFTIAVEGACITTSEWVDDPDGCVQRVQGALEEIEATSYSVSPRLEAR